MKPLLGGGQRQGYNQGFDNLGDCGVAIQFVDPNGFYCWSQVSPGAQVLAQINTFV